jgi:cysteine-rich repeat protein
MRLYLLAIVVWYVSVCQGYLFECSECDFDTFAMVPCDAGQQLDSICVTCPLNGTTASRGTGSIDGCVNSQQCMDMTGRIEVCMDGIRDVSEECDDGNSVNGDGCSNLCQLEEVDINMWLCENVIGFRTSCCISRVNPLTQQYTCDCADIVQPDTSRGFTITPECVLRDVDECNEHDCHHTAICINHDTRYSDHRYECLCPTGWHGNATLGCEINEFYTVIVVVKLGVTTMNVHDLGLNLTLWGVIPVWHEGIEGSSRPYIAGGPDANGEPQVQSGVEITFTLLSMTKEIMYVLSESINISAIPAHFLIPMPPESVIAIAAGGGGQRLSPLVGGFSIDDIALNEATGMWDITGVYVPVIPNTITSPFISKNTVPSLQAFPCLHNNNICCLQEYRDLYEVGRFADAIASKVDPVCVTPPSTQASSTVFDVPAGLSWMAELLDEYPASTQDSELLTRTSARYTYSISTVDVKDSFSKKVSFPDGHYELSWYVGMAYFTMLNINEIVTWVSQHALAISVTPMVSTTFTSDASYSFVKFIALVVYENKWLDPFLDLHRLQFVTIGLVLPSNILQNMDTGLIPLDSIRYVVGSSMPSKNDPSWINPCYSNSYTGMYDAGMPWEAMYRGASLQPCAFNRRMCTNPISATNLGLVEFNFPIGNGTITPTMRNDRTHYLFVQLGISAKDIHGNLMMTTVMSTAKINLNSISMACETLSAEMSLADLVSVDLTVGLVGTNAEWDTSVVTRKDALDTNPSLIPITPLGASLPSSLITLIVQPKPALARAYQSSTLRIELDYLVSMHFLDTAKFTQMQALLQSGDAYTVDTVGGFLEIQITPSATNMCSANNQNQYSCGIRRDVVRRIPRNGGAADFANNYSSDNAGCIAFITENLLTQGHDLAASMTDIVRTKYAIDNRLSRAWYVNPGFNWPIHLQDSKQTYFQLADQMIVIAAVSLHGLDPVDPSPARRRILQVATSPSLENYRRHIQQLQDTPISATTPAIHFTTDVPQTIANMFSVPENTNWLLVDMDIQVRDVTTSLQETYRELALTIKQDICPECIDVHIVFHNIIVTSQVQVTMTLLLTTNQDVADPKPLESLRRILQIHDRYQITTSSIRYQKSSHVFHIPESRRVEPLESEPSTPIVGIVVGVLVGLVFVIPCCIYLIKQQHSTTQNIPKHQKEPPKHSRSQLRTTGFFESLHQKNRH